MTGRYYLPDLLDSLVHHNLCPTFNEVILARFAEYQGGQIMYYAGASQAETCEYCIMLSVELS